MDRTSWEQIRRHYRDLLQIDRKHDRRAGSCAGRFLLRLPVKHADCLQRIHIPPTPRQMRISSLIRAQELRRSKRVALRLNACQLSDIGAF